MSGFKLPKEERAKLHRSFMLSMVASGKFPDQTPPKKGEQNGTAVSKPFGVAVWADALVRAHESVVNDWDDERQNGARRSGDQP